MNLVKLDRWHQSKQGLLMFGVFELAVAYALVSLAIDDGNLLVYVLSLFFAVGGVKNIVKLVKVLAKRGHTA